MNLEEVELRCRWVIMMVTTIGDGDGYEDVDEDEEDDEDEGEDAHPRPHGPHGR